MHENPDREVPMRRPGEAEDDPVLTVEEAAAVVRCHPVTLYKMVDGQQLPAARFGRALRIRLSDLMALFNVSERRTA
jgi:excisionase family DNA binding protein